MPRAPTLLFSLDLAVEVTDIFFHGVVDSVSLLFSLDLAVEVTYPLGVAYFPTEMKPTASQESLAIDPALQSAVDEIQAGWTEAEHYEKAGVPVPTWLDRNKARDQGGQYQPPHYSWSSHERIESDDIQQGDESVGVVFTRLPEAGREGG